MTLTIGQLTAVMPAANGKSKILEALNEAMPRFGIDTRDEIAMFLANLAHESGEYRWMQEIWGPTKEQKTYERDFTMPWGSHLVRGDRNFKPYTLGNSEGGDGRRYAGHGPIQVTGRTNHTIMGFILEMDFVSEPNLLTDIRIGTLAAAAFWWNNKLDDKAKKGFVPVVKAINGGTNGLADRQKYLDRALRVL